MSLAKTHFWLQCEMKNWSLNRADSFKLQASLLVTKTSAENKKLCFYKRRFQLKIRIFAFTNQVFHGTVKAVCAGLQWPFEPKNCLSCNGRLNQKTVWTAMVFWNAKLSGMRWPFEPRCYLVCNGRLNQKKFRTAMAIAPKNCLHCNDRLNQKTA